MLRFALMALALALALEPVAAEVLFSGVPTVKVVVDAENIQRSIIPDERREESRVVIEQRGNRVFWATRDDAELVRQLSGAFHIFQCVDGCGYVKIFDTHYVPESIRDDGPRYRYMEHVHLSLSAISYFGSME